jgi:hypothetical protein
VTSAAARAARRLQRRRLRRLSHHQRYNIQTKFFQPAKQHNLNLETPCHKTQRECRNVKNESNPRLQPPRASTLNLPLLCQQRDYDTEAHLSVGLAAQLLPVPQPPQQQALRTAEHHRPLSPRVKAAPTPCGVISATNTAVNMTNTASLSSKTKINIETAENLRASSPRRCATAAANAAAARLTTEQQLLHKRRAASLGHVEVPESSVATALHT